MPAYEENAILDDVEQDGEILLLADGRRLSVNPEDAAVTSIWAHAARLTLREGKGGSRRAAVNFDVTNEETGDTIAARIADAP